MLVPGGTSELCGTLQKLTFFGGVGVLLLQSGGLWCAEQGCRALWHFGRAGGRGRPSPAAAELAAGTPVRAPSLCCVTGPQGQAGTPLWDARRPPSAPGRIWEGPWGAASRRRGSLAPCPAVALGEVQCE